ncbi:MAG TPA: hypothetical protein VK338_00490 [Candidatus Nitrosocosmicus sp.]|nr:hypothetical protein [Candidatus Nitrosocosmicus sp.]
MKKLIVIADWANDPVEKQTVRTTIEGYSKTPNEVHISNVPTLSSTIHTGYVLAQLVETEERYGRPLETVFCVDTNNVKETETQNGILDKAQLIIIRLSSGIYICGMNRLYNFSCIKDKIEEVYEYNPPTIQDQHQLKMRICVHLLEAEQDNLDFTEITPIILPLQEFYIGHIDTCGHLKTTITAENFKGKYEINDLVSLTINNKEYKARYVQTLLRGPEDEILIAPSSYGKRDNPYLEIGCNINTFKDVNVGDKIVIN